MEKMDSTFSRTTLKFFFALYCIGTAYLLFVYQREIDLSWMVRGGLFDNLDDYANFIPFKNIISYFVQMNRVTGVYIILENIVAHMFVFAWLGYFMPRIWGRFRDPLNFLRTVFIILCAVEIVQFLTRTGMLDIDDLILNFLAAFLGFVYLRHIDVEEEELPYV